jgi:hypothetical protein
MERKGELTSQYGFAIGICIFEYFSVLFVIILEEIPLKNISDGNCRFQ